MVRRHTRAVGCLARFSPSTQTVLVILTCIISWRVRRTDAIRSPDWLYLARPCMEPPLMAVTGVMELYSRLTLMAQTLRCCILSPLILLLLLRQAWFCRMVNSMGRPILAEAQGLGWSMPRSEEHTSELQSLAYLVCRLLLEKK